MRGVLRSLVQNIDNLEIPAKSGPKVENWIADNDNESDTITQAWFWPVMGAEFLQENDIVVTETGTANFGIWGTKFPGNVVALSQVLWGSVGWSVGACQGAALVAKDAGATRRTILFVGDGSFQLTAQEVSTMLKLDLKPIIFVICNDGYTIERLIHGFDEQYNNIPQWNYKDIVNVFGGTAKGAKTYQVKTKKEVGALFKDKEFRAANVLQFVELYMPWDDAPRALKMTAEASARTNATLD